MKLNTILPLTALYFGLCSASFAEQIKVGDLTLDNPAIRATVPGAKVAGGFMIIKNNGTTPERLLAGSASFAGKVEIHEMKVVDEIMKMRKLQDGLEIPAGGSVHLKPGSYHVMFMKLGEQMKAGEMRKAKLVFKNAGEVEVPFMVQTIAKTMKHGKMDHGKMKMKKKSN